MKRILLLALLILGLGLTTPSQLWGTPTRQEQNLGDPERGGGDDDEPFKTGQVTTTPVRQPQSGDVSGRPVLQNDSQPSISKWRAPIKDWLHSVLRLISRSG